MTLSHYNTLEKDFYVISNIIQGGVMTLFSKCIKAQRILLLISSAEDSTKMKTLIILALLGCCSAFPGIQNLLIIYQFFSNYPILNQMMDFIAFFSYLIYLFCHNYRFWLKPRSTKDQRSNIFNCCRQRRRYFFCQNNWDL